LQAAAGLGGIGAADERVVPALVKALDDEDADVRGVAAERLGELGVVDAPAPTRP
jgi:HEAT repeat protein